ncbi:putative pectinesterase inhibitor domain-containing protein [Medicago truncatula]|uniref:Plant invertase/pectin methylesterase inhibitor n=1 Tax=Medicago truncatula TaxID=3880 RepID=A0A072TNA9_MEDTR|nr:pectinesterase inhibitor 1 [Medicago truncatula]KEH18979.1 plant invertase/pectin methylesterase inhibitor [Medicago truncatula]RHN40072.1 putative pectinesterase inhibitor domain-containing protein [Medicago truncatula]
MVRFLSIMVVFLACVASSYATNVVNVQEICKKATNPSFCSTILESKPGGAGKDLVSLASYTIDVLRTNVSNTISLITKLAAQSGSDSLKQNRYKNCLSRFGMDDGALGEVEEAQKVLKDSDYNGVNMHITSVMTAVDECLSKDSSPDNDTSLLPKDVECVNQIAQIILIISNVLLN